MTRERLCYLGPQGSYCEEAAVKFADALGVSAEATVPEPHIAAALEAVAEGGSTWAVVPGENSTEGSVNLTWDLFLRYDCLAIAGEVYLPIKHNLLGHRGARLEGIGAVLSHPQALAQCREFLRRQLPDAELHEVSSTAEAARVVSVNHSSLAAIGSENAGKAYGLDVLASEIQDVPDNTTRFLLVGRADNLPSPSASTGRDRTSLVCAGEKNKPGSLRDILSVFADRGVDLSRIESRPARRRFGEYVFYVDLVGHRSDPAVAEALQVLQENRWLLRELGSYPRA